MPTWTRRRFVGTTLGTLAAVRAASPEVLVPSAGKPVVVASSNGNQFKNGGPRTCVAEAFERIAKGEAVIDAVVAGVNILELDPEEQSVGFGGLPNADGIVQLDASVMDGVKRRAGAVACLEGVRTPSKVALEVANQTDHHLLVGHDAQVFARQRGFTIEDDLNTPNSRKLWLEWKRQIDPAHWLDPATRESAGLAARERMIARGLVDPDHVFGTVHCSGLGPGGAIAAVTTTSGLAFKIPGRVGDSPILGAGNYVDGAVGAAGSTGRGEANLYHVASFVIVEAMRRGAHPKDAAMEAVSRIKAGTREKRLLNARGLPNFQLKFYALDRAGRHAGVALWSYQSTYAACDENGPRTIPMDALLEGNWRDQ